MPFNDYSQLTDEINDMLARGDVRTKIPGWITLAENEIVQRVRSLMSVIYIASGTLVAGTNTLTLPAKTTAILSLQLDNNPLIVIRPVELDELKKHQSTWSSTTRDFPSVYTRISDTKIEMSATPAASSPYTIYYEAFNAEITERSTTSQLLAQAPQLLLYGAAKHSAPFLRNDRAGEWRDLFEGGLKPYNKFLARISTDTLQVASYAAGINDQPFGNT